MSIINKIKLNYNLKLLDDLIVNQKNEAILVLLRDTKKKKQRYFLSPTQALKSTILP